MTVTYKSQPKIKLNIRPVAKGTSVLNKHKIEKDKQAFVPPGLHFQGVPSLTL